MTEETMAQLEEIRTTAMVHEQKLLDVAADIPDLREMLGPQFFKVVQQTESEDPVQQYILVGEYLQRLGEKTVRLKTALLNLQFWEQYPWPEAMLKLLKQ